MKELEQLQLTESDFKLLTDGLDALPNSGMAGEIMGTLLESMMTKDDPEMRAEMMARKKQEERVKAAERSAKIEEIRILQGKLFQLQRYLRMNGLLKEANDILKD